MAAPREARFGAGALRLALAAPDAPPAVAVAGEDPETLEDAVKAAVRAAPGPSLALRVEGSLPLDDAAAVVVHSLAGELARGGAVTEAVVLLADDAALAAYAAALARIAPR